MKNFILIIFVLIMTAFCTNSFSQRQKYPFEVKITGTGKQTLIFIPGFSCSGRVWDETRESFEKEYTCYTLTMAGFAGVEAQPDPSFYNWEAAIADYIRRNKIEKPVIVGHSMGGGLAMALAADYSELVSKIIVVDALPCLSALINPSFQPKETNDCSQMVTQITSATNEQFYLMQKMSITQMLADTSKRDTVVCWSVKSDRKTFAEMYCDFSNTDLREKVKKIKCPSLILLEGYFKNIQPAINEQFKNLGTATIKYSTKGLHFIMFDDKEWYISELCKFIKS